MFNTGSNTAVFEAVLNTKVRPEAIRRKKASNTGLNTAVLKTVLKKTYLLNYK